MDRRAFLLGSLSALAGCSAFPRDRGYPAEYYKPQLLFEWTWRPDARELEVEVVGGNPLTAGNTAELSIHRSPFAEPVVWASRDGEGQGEFPVEPGDSLTVPVEERETVRVVWSDGTNSVSLDAFRFADGTATPEGADG